MFHPGTTYRLQFHAGFPFEAFEKIIPYLKELGITTVYASPIFEATPGSNHGYDALNPHRINPEIGTIEQFQQLSAILREQGISWLQDIVPNHMAFDTRNPWLVDVLEKGAQSSFASYFDLGNSMFEGKLMVPFLGAALEEVLKSKELKAGYREGRLVLSYYDSHYPLQAGSYDFILKNAAPTENIQQLQQLVHNLHHVEDPAAFSSGFREMLQQFAVLLQQEPSKKNIEISISSINEDPVLLQQLAEAQHYRLCHWQETDRQINYRRFFTVNGLVCLNIQQPAVFDHFHQFLHSLLQQDMIQGLRVDHIDGLYDPVSYLHRLKEMAGPETYVTVEKILAPGEDLPGNWEVEGTTGYDFLAMVNNLLSNPKAGQDFTQFYFALAQHHRTVAQQVRDKKWYVLNEHMGGELNNLYRLFVESDLVLPDRLAAVGENDLKKTIGAFLVFCPVYRFYGNHLPLQEEEAREVKKILCTVREWCAELHEAVQLLEEVLLVHPPIADASYRGRALHFYQRCMQFSGPLMAKGVEDTLMYTFNRFIAHNEVGDAPEAFGYSLDTFHQKMKERQQRWPLTMNATATHDTKRGEDFRARLHVLTDLEDEWLQAVTQWEGEQKATAPDANDRYFIYQTLIGSLPFSEQEEHTYKDRLGEYLQKALREAKRHSNWTTPDEAYEAAAKNFAIGLLDQNSSFRKSFDPLWKKVAGFGIVNSLVQVLLKFTCPGLPDTYQGCELWDFSFVDPDNRRPVDFDARAKALDACIQNADDENFVQHLWHHRSNAQIKLWLTHRLLQLRNTYADLFADGAYVPLKVEGTYKNHVIAFARKHQENWLVVVVPLHVAAIQENPATTVDWKDTKINVPHEVLEDWEDVFLGRKGKQQKGLRVREIFGTLPFSVLKMKAKNNQRNAGILLHISSLPGPFGIGDMGPEAKAFADFLSHSNQRIWQLLPINPTEGGQGYSPYSAVSSRAGNTMLISPELMVSEGLLTRDELQTYFLPAHAAVDFEAAANNKNQLFEMAWLRYKQKPAPALQQYVLEFSATEQEWLPDFALYTVLKQQQGGKPWYEWPDPYKLRAVEALQQLISAHADAIEKVKWLQAIFSRQWKALKTYCNKKSIRLLGDLPIYVSYDSADVWSNRELFKLDAAGQREGIAGVPPDAFSDDGQLWGMPVYRWDKVQENNFDWWIQRLKKNIELFDQVRLDHFRAFADYWEVPAGEATARNGSWQQGPGAAFFKAVEEQLGVLPFVAEDLGEINDQVRQLRDDFGLPGMKVLQFAFGEELPASEFIPHNYTENFVVYTGTHDNNTTRGWYREANEAMQHRVREYFARDITEENIAYWMGRAAHASVAKTVILPMQDVLSLDEKARMNIPASAQHNWAWRLLPGQITRAAIEQLRNWTLLYNRT